MISIHSRVVHLSHLKEMSTIFLVYNYRHYLPYPKGKQIVPWQPTMLVESMQQLLFMSNFIFSFMISIHSRVVHLSHLKEMSAIFSITTDINDISATQVLDRDFLLILNVNQFLSRDQSREESGFNF